MSAVFITGTDTGVGKTFVTCALARALRAGGRRVAVMKPVETGVETGPADAMALKIAAGDPAPLDAICPHRFRAPLAPAIAARAEGMGIDVVALAERVRARAALADPLLVEGAGGLLVPLDARTTFLDFACRLALPVLVVAANRLGTINHTALTVRAARGAGLHVVGVVLSSPTRDTDASAATNAAVISALCDVSPVEALAHVDPEAATVALAVALSSGRLRLTA